MNHSVQLMLGLIASLLGATGSLYLAYDLLGGANGLLGNFTRLVTYTISYIVIFGLGMGLRFGLLAGTGLGITLGVEYWFVARVSRRDFRFKPHLTDILLSSLARALSIGLGLAWQFRQFEIFPWFFLVDFLGVFIGYWVGLAPAASRRVDLRPGFSRRELIAAPIRGMAAALALYVSMRITGVDIGFRSTGIRLFLTVTLGSVILSYFVPSVEWITESLPKRWLVGVGAACVVMGFFLQTVIYCVQLFN
jgi:hypothetical protein